jgi:uncharacterized small protein (DUF1192 family)
MVQGARKREHLLGRELARTEAGLSALDAERAAASFRRKLAGAAT